MPIVVRGLKAFWTRLNNAGPRRRKALDLALDDTADAIHWKASELVPVLQGFLRRSIIVRRSPLRKRVVVASDYAAWIEFGLPVGGTSPAEFQYGKDKGKPRGRPMGPRPFLRPAFDTESKRLKKFLKLRLAKSRK